MKTGLVLEGGAMRGMYAAGVLDTFPEAGIRVDGVVGVSAGALFGVNYLSRQKGRVIRYNKRFNKDKNYMGLRPLLREGNLISTHYAYRKTPMPRLPLKLLHRSYPQIARQLLCRHETYNNALDLLAQWEKEGKAFAPRSPSASTAPNETPGSSNRSTTWG